MHGKHENEQQETFPLAMSLRVKHKPYRALYDKNIMTIVIPRAYLDF